MSDETHYDVLRVPPDASQDAIHRAYVSLLARFQREPDQSPETVKRKARARLAYRVLSEDDSRAVYNAQQGLEEPPRRRWEIPDEPADQVKRRSLLIAVLFWWMWWR